MTFFKRIFGFRQRPPKEPCGKPNARAYIVGDVHGRLDLLDRLVAMIECDNVKREPRETYVVFLGDLIDRGPDSAGVIERLRTYKPAGAKTVFLAGNHEEVLLRILQGDSQLLPSWLRFGGAECAQSYGVRPELLASVDEGTATHLLKSKIPQSHQRFLESFADTFRFGDYVCVHAGIRPGVPLEEQDRQDLRWIRGEFLNHAQDYGFIVVHGHTIVAQVEERSNRIAIDTGAYQSGALTALAIEEHRRWWISTSGDPNMFSIDAPA